MKLIGLAGPAGVGKDTIADYLVETHAFTKFSFSDALYDEVAAAFDIDKALLYARETKEKPIADLQTWLCLDPAFSSLMWNQLRFTQHERYPSDVWCSPRQILQWWGTEYRRKQDADYWIKKAALTVEAYLRLAKEDPETQRGGMINASVRFENERRFIEQLQGEVWHVQRHDYSAIAPEQKAHVAEKGLTVLERDKGVLNNGTIEQLHTAANLLLGSHPGSHIKCGVDTFPDRVTCVRCGWVHMTYTRSEAQREVNTFNSWLAEQTDETKAAYGCTDKGSRVEDYEGCDRCGGKEFLPSKPGDCPDGCTIGPVIYEERKPDVDVYKDFVQPPGYTSDI